MPNYSLVYATFHQMKNIKVVNKEGSDCIILEVVLEKPTEVEMILKNYKNGRFLSMFRQHLILADVIHNYTWSIDIDVDRAHLLKATLQRYRSA